MIPDQAMNRVTEWSTEVVRAFVVEIPNRDS